MIGAASAQSPSRHRRPPYRHGPSARTFNETSHYADVWRLWSAAAKAAPKFIHLTTFGKTFEGRTLPLAVVGAPDATPEAVRRTGKLRVYIQGNIHAGEVEGKESAQMLLRELAEGKHADWLKSMVLLIAPIYNADGNEKFALNNRGRQHGPMAGQGQRPNAQGFDLNRDHMKLDSPEARAFVKLMNDYDPHVSMDLHTTNGTRHAYHLTYSPPLNPATDPAIINLLRNDWLPSVTKTIKTKYGWDYYYYGNLEGRGESRHAGGRRSTHVLASTTTTSAFETGLRSSARPTLMRRSKIASRRRTGSWKKSSTTRNTHAAGIRKVTEAADRQKIAGSKLPLHAELERSRAGCRDPAR